MKIAVVWKGWRAITCGAASKATQTCPRELLFSDTPMVLRCRGESLMMGLTTERNLFEFYWIQSSFIGLVFPGIGAQTWKIKSLNRLMNISCLYELA